MTVDTKKLRELAVKLRAYIDSPAAFEMARAEYRVHTHPDALLDLLDEIETSRHVLGGLPQDAIDGGWTALGMSNYAKRLETRRNELLSENHYLRKDAERVAWQPIETAPRHTAVLVWREDSGPFIAKFATPEAVITVEEMERDELEFPDDFEEWYSDAYGWQEGSEKPTHWMPLPDAPKVDAALALRESGHEKGI